jgi:hypothetical protein
MSELVRVTKTFLDPKTNTNFDPDGNAATVEFFDYAGVTYFTASAVRESLGVYHADVTIDDDDYFGTWEAHWTYDVSPVLGIEYIETIYMPPSVPVITNHIRTSANVGTIDVSEIGSTEVVKIYGAILTTNPTTVAHVGTITGPGTVTLDMSLLCNVWWSHSMAVPYTLWAVTENGVGATATCTHGLPTLFMFNGDVVDTSNLIRSEDGTTLDFDITTTLSSDTIFLVFYTDPGHGSIDDVALQYLEGTGHHQLVDLTPGRSYIFIIFPFEFGQLYQIASMESKYPDPHWVNNLNLG